MNRYESIQIFEGKQLCYGVIAKPSTTVAAASVPMRLLTSSYHHCHWHEIAGGMYIGYQCPDPAGAFKFGCCFAARRARKSFRIHIGITKATPMSPWVHSCF